jgi:glycosyltransferase involved in cell wall biosynthesis
MKIGFDISQTGATKAGCGFFADSLIQSLAGIDHENEYMLYPTFGDSFWDPEWEKSVRHIPQSNFHSVKGHKTFEAARAFWSDSNHDLEKELHEPDVIHSNNFFCPKGLKKTRLIYTLHDLSFVDWPDWHTEENRVGCFKGVFEASIYADFVISVSQYSRKHFLETFPHYPADRINVIYEASRFSIRHDLRPPSSVIGLVPDRFWLNVGTLEPRKNQERVIRAYSKLKAEAKTTFPLVFAGGIGWLMQDFKRTIRELGLSKDVLILGYVDDTTLHWLYQNCFAFVYPSLFEGFGLPILEAMSLGKAVITSNVASIPEIVGDAGILVDPLDETAICQAMMGLAKNPQFHADLKDRAANRAKKFSWNEAAKAVLDCYRRCTLRFPRDAVGRKK